MRDFPSPPSLKYPYCHKGMLSSAARAIRQQRLWHSWELNDPLLCCPSISGPGNSPLSLYLVYITSLLNLAHRGRKSTRVWMSGALLVYLTKSMYHGIAWLHPRGQGELMAYSLIPFLVCPCSFYFPSLSDRGPCFHFSTRLSYYPPILWSPITPPCSHIGTVFMCPWW